MQHNMVVAASSATRVVRESTTTWRRTDDKEQLTAELGLQGKVAMVGGASKGLGFSVARMLAAEGVSISIASRDEGRISDAARQLEQEYSVQVLHQALDLRSNDGIIAWRDATLERFGGVDLLFSNTGGPPAGGFMQFDDAAWHDGFDLLVLSIVRMVRAVVPSMEARGGGAIVMSTSSAVKEPIPNLTISTVLRAWGRRSRRHWRMNWSVATSVSTSSCQAVSRPIVSASWTRPMPSGSARHWKMCASARKRPSRCSVSANRMSTARPRPSCSHPPRPTSRARPCRWMAARFVASCRTSSGP